MPVKKYRDISDMPDSNWLEPGSPELMEAMRASWSFAQKTMQPRFPPGVHRHRSIEDLWAQEERWDQANFVRHQQRIREHRSSPISEG